MSEVTLSPAFSALIKYIELILSEEGITYIEDWERHSFSNEEWELLKLAEGIALSPKKI